MPDSYLVHVGHWSWLGVGYFFLGGIAGGCSMLAATADLFGRGEHRRVSRVGHLVALVAVLLGSVLLVVDLKRPERFWHMLVQSERAPALMLKWWSPMSIGAWALFLFGAVALLAVIGDLAADGRLRARWLAPLGDGVPAHVLSAIGGVLGFFLASYTGVLLSVTNRPMWSESSLLGLVFLLSAASTSCALLVLLLRRRPDAEPSSVRWLATLDARVMVLEAVAIGAFVLLLGSGIRPLLGPWGLLLALGVVGVGILLPFALHLRRTSSRPVAWAPICVLIGGLLLRAVVVLSVERT